MPWKQTLGKPNDTYIIGKRWVKKNIPKSNKISKANHKESCPGAIYDLGMHYLPDNSQELQQIWVCMETGELLAKAPEVIAIAKPKPRKVKQTEVVSPKKKPIPMKVKPKPKAEPEPEPIPVFTPPPIVDATPEPTATRETLVNEVKGIGKAAFEKLDAAGIVTINDLLSKHSQEIATLIGRKSDAQIKKWQDTAREMIG